jgi:hypothetical protein
MIAVLLDVLMPLLIVGAVGWAAALGEAWTARPGPRGLSRDLEARIRRRDGQRQRNRRIEARLRRHDASEA